MNVDIVILAVRDVFVIYWPPLFLCHTCIHAFSSLDDHM